MNCETCKEYAYWKRRLEWTGPDGWQAKGSLTAEERNKLWYFLSGQEEAHVEGAVRDR